MVRTRGFRAAIGSALLLAACGGDGNTAPGDGGDGPDGSLAGIHELIGVNDQGLPVTTAPEDCTSTKFWGGKIRLTDDGSWDIVVDWSDETGNFQLRDGGDFEQEADTHLLLRSEEGDLYGGIVHDDAIVVTFDFCHDGQPGTDFVFER